MQYYYEHTMIWRILFPFNANAEMDFHRMSVLPLVISVHATAASLRLKTVKFCNFFFLLDTGAD